MLKLLNNVLICPHDTDLPYFMVKEPNSWGRSTWAIQRQEASWGCPPRTPAACGVLSHHRGDSTRHSHASLPQSQGSERGQGPRFCVHVAGAAPGHKEGILFRCPDSSREREDAKGVSSD